MRCMGVGDPREALRPDHDQSWQAIGRTLDFILLKGKDVGGFDYRTDLKKVTTMWGKCQLC